MWPEGLSSSCEGFKVSAGAETEQIAPLNDALVARALREKYLSSDLNGFHA